MNRAKSKNQSAEDPKKGEGIRSTAPIEGSQEIPPPQKIIIIEVRDETNEIEEKSSNGDSKESGAATSDHQRKDQDEATPMLKEGDSMGLLEEELEPETNEEEEEEGEIKLSTPRRTKTKGRKYKKEVRDQATYKTSCKGPS